ncbi:MAG TPA: dihydroorotate dehydrogenase electron transfer subunit [Bacillota bacterium]|nr:dihydroorotate dehydrogenase electron transfer subunit [Bacillota bacterium]
MIQVKALITENTVLAPGYYRIGLLAPEVASQAQPGQFVQIRVAGESCTDPLLSRPISIYRVDRTTGMIFLIYKTVGRGTTILAGEARGAILEVLGPIGNGFHMPENAKGVALVGGGVGMPPLYCLAELLKAKQPELSITLFYGGRSRSDILELEAWEQLGVELCVATEDGSYGTKGLVTTMLLNKLQDKKFDYLAACGPEPMLKAVQQIALEQQLAGEISLEAHMACGVGACLGCTCNTAKGYRRVCVDGPVFNLSEVTF